MINANLGSRRLSIGVVAIGRPTFDVPYAESLLATAMAALEGLDADIVGSTALQFDAEAMRSNLGALTEKPLDLLLVLQVTFTDATMTVELAKSVDAPLVLWSFPEPRSGGRLRLNGFCGINLAAHALGKAGQSFDYVHREADSPEALKEIMALARAGYVKRRLTQTRIGVVGEHPAGFDTCSYDTAELKSRFGVETQTLPIGGFIASAAAVDDAKADAVRARAAGDLGSLDDLDQDSLQKSMKVYVALRGLADEENLQALAVRCWPEFFTDFGCAACGPMAFMNQDGTPCGCEADVFGALSSLVLQWTAGEPAFNTDLVDVNVEDDTAVFWHCGQAPISMADPEGPIGPAIHSNRKLPLLNEFALKPGRVTLARLTQAKNEIRLVLGGAEILRAPLSFSGTSGVVRFDKPAGEVLERIMREGLEHHTGLVYGEHRPALRRLAAMLDLPVIELT
ncbi:L-fucose/L-arabinose isomerase family protein [Denitrobaculum tricleocarpae]|uniref:Fucose isomerase n=1 Tax=Denitrobaculum tricleocarpae TaxID=2591009 RepID=A0A545SZ93_9PROT|nr:L-fucose/L-arabinose isomerase family protein [Denitrobaculum tricleocarpae]TQV70287.1 fucose isomerase [Denitrobaculum tricleocarpae]